MTGDRHPLDDIKRTLRLQAQAARRVAHANLAATAGERIAAAFLAGFSGQIGPVVAGYWPMGEEADVRPLLEQLTRRGVIAALPVVVAPHAPLQFRRWVPGDALEAGRHGTRHPFASADIAVPDILLLPLLAFDARGGRLGYGGGYYDRTLEVLRAERGRRITAIGIGYAAQAVDAVPRGRHDQPLDWIVTEDGAREVHR
jgi:5-formyltetrahydrofolate cyclo-ligase